MKNGHFYLGNNGTKFKYQGVLKPIISSKGHERYDWSLSDIGFPMTEITEEEFLVKEFFAKH